jgi:hypothetical protein
MKWYFMDYIRRRIGEAASAGFYDVLAPGNGLTTEQAAAAFASFGLPQVEATGPPASPKQPAQLAGPRAADASATSDTVRRGPGRPRKYQEPPATEGPEAGG